MKFSRIKSICSTVLFCDIRPINFKSKFCPATNSLHGPKGEWTFFFYFVDVLVLYGINLCILLNKKNTKNLTRDIIDAGNSSFVESFTIYYWWESVYNIQFTLFSALICRWQLVQLFLFFQRCEQYPYTLDIFLEDYHTTLWQWS